MSNMNDSNKFILRRLVIIIIVILNVIALIAVFWTVGGTVKKLKNDIATGKISKEKTQNIQYQNTEAEENETTTDSYDDELDMDLDIDMQSIFKLAIADKNVRKSLILMVFALILLAGAIYILIKLK